MAFNIHQLDNLTYEGAEDEEHELELYQNSIIEEFKKSDECIVINKEGIEPDFWIGQMIYYGIGYIGTTLPSMTVNDVSEILEDIFPKKIILSSPEDADVIIPILIAFWSFIKAKYKLKNSNVILKYLNNIKKDYKSIMNDSSSFGMAKSFFTQGLESGYDMTDQNDNNKFIESYNEDIISYTNNLQNLTQKKPKLATKSLSKKANLKKKKLRKMQKSSRKKNKKRK